MHKYNAISLARMPIVEARGVEARSSRLLQTMRGLSIALFLFLLLHFESISIGGLKVAHLWKVGFALILLTYILLSSRGVIKLQCFLPLIFLVFIQPLNYEWFLNPIGFLGVLAQMLLFPVVGIFLASLPSRVLRKVLVFIPFFIVLSFVPYELGFLKSLGKELDMGAYGAAEVFSNVGLFATPHSASSALAFSFLILMYLWVAKVCSRFLVSLVLVLCLYFLLSTYVRTGLAMALVGALFFMWRLMNSDPKRFFRTVSLVLVVGLLSGSWVTNNQVLMDRILGQRLHNSEDSFERLGSGRGRLILASYDIYMKSNTFEKVFGLGDTEQKARMNREIGLSLVPHNGFLYLLLANGILGLSLFLWFIWKVWKYFGRLGGIHQTLAASSLAAYLVLTFLQNFNLVYSFVIFLVIAAYSIRIEYEPIS